MRTPSSTALTTLTSRASRPRLIPALVAVGLAMVCVAGCGDDSDTEGDSASDSAPDPAEVGDQPAEGAGDEPADSGFGAGTATVVLDSGGSYIFGGTGEAASDGQCREIMGALIVSLALTHVDNEPVEAGAGSIDLEVHGEATAADSQLTLKLPDGLFWAGSVETTDDAPAFAVARGDGLTAGGSQPMVSSTGEQATAVVNATCE